MSTLDDLQREIDRVRALYRKHYASDPDYGNGPEIKRALQRANEKRLYGSASGMQEAIASLQQFSDAT